MMAKARTLREGLVNSLITCTSSNAKNGTLHKETAPEECFPIALDEFANSLDEEKWIFHRLSFPPLRWRL